MNSKTRKSKVYSLFKKLKQDLGNYSKRKTRLVEYIKKISSSRKKKNK